MCVGEVSVQLCLVMVHVQAYPDKVRVQVSADEVRRCDGKVHVQICWQNVYPPVSYCVQKMYVQACMSRYELIEYVSTCVDKAVSSRCGERQW